MKGVIDMPSAKAAKAPKLREYELEYERQYCVDDGGIGHDVYWTDTIHNIKARNDREAMAAAREILFGNRHACGGFGCNNMGYRRFGRLIHRTVVEKPRLRTESVREVRVPKYFH